MSNNLYYEHRDRELQPLDREAKPASAGPVIYFFAALLIAALAISWVNAHNRSLPLFGWESYNSSASTEPRT